MKSIEPLADHAPTPDGYFRLVGLAALTCGRCGCQVAVEMREGHRKVCIFTGASLEPEEVAS